MKTLKYSRQRESIKNCLMSRCDHPTADVLYMDIRNEFPNISLGTVYRNLNLLVELGEIQKLASGNGADHFDADTTTHYHFVCKSCWEISDLPMHTIDGIESEAAKYAQGAVDSHNIMFYGTCSECLKKNSH